MQAEAEAGSELREWAKPVPQTNYVAMRQAFAKQFGEVRGFRLWTAVWCENFGKVCQQLLLMVLPEAATDAKPGELRNRHALSEWHPQYIYLLLCLCLGKGMKRRKTRCSKIFSQSWDISNRSQG